MGPRTERTIGGLRENGNIFRKAPSRAVDEAWSLVAMDGFEVINATAADLRAAGEDPNVAARWDVGVDAYPVEVEVSHKVLISFACSPFLVWGKRMGRYNVCCKNALVRIGKRKTANSHY